MATQGMVVVKHDGTVIMKIVSGCNGHKTKAVAKKLKKAWPLSTDQAYELAMMEDFGCPNCLVVATALKVAFRGNGSIDAQYSGKAFSEERFNPRSKTGTPEIMVVISI